MLLLDFTRRQIKLDDNKVSDHQIDIERQIIHLMLKDRRAVDEIIDEGYGIDFFIQPHRFLVESIYHEYMDSGQTRLLNRESYKQKLLDNNKGDLVECMQIYDKCYLQAFAEMDDLGHLKKSFVEGFIGQRTIELLKKYNKETKKIGYLSAARSLVDHLQQLVSVTEIRQTVFAPIYDIKDEYLQRLKERKENKDAIVRCGIPEIDDAIEVGFGPQQMTLFVADVGGHKTNTMLNIAICLYLRGYNVLFIPLEMDRLMLMDRIIANIAEVNFHKLAHPELITEEEQKRITESTIWLKKDHQFCILDADERTSVSRLQIEIENRAKYFKPAVVIIDYIANLQPDVRFGSRNDLEIGEILKNLRFLGKKYGFHIISAAQMGRAAIKALREGKEGAVDSTAVHGSHQYSADSDTVFALMQNPNETDRLKLLTIKARYGPKGVSKELQVDAQYCRITSTENTMETAPTGILDLQEAINQPTSEIADSVAEKKNKLEFSTDFDDLDLGD